MSTPKLLAALSLALLFTHQTAGGAPLRNKALGAPILFVTQFPIPSDFATIGSTFANHRAATSLTGRGGDLYIRYADGSLRNLTAEAGFGNVGLQLGNSISVRDPDVHFSGTKAVFSMVIGAPAQFQQTQFYFQLYEVTGFGQGQTVVITKVPNQPADFNNVQPTYASDGTILFVSDRPRSGERHLYPQHDEYESTATPTGVWKLNPANGQLQLMQHSPSGSFDPFVDSFGRVVFTRWDHLQRDQQADDPDSMTFNWTSEAADAPKVPASEVFPELRVVPQGNPVNGHTLNLFFPWVTNQDGTGEETVNHIGRHELHDYFNFSFNGDPNLREFIGATSGRLNPRELRNIFHIHEDPTQAGRYLGIDAPEFGTHGAGQIVRLVAPPTLNPDQIIVEYLTPRSTAGTGTAADHSGHYRNVITMTDGAIVAAHDPTQGEAGNNGTGTNPDPRYKFRLKRLAAGTGGALVPVETLTPGNGISKTISFWNPDQLVSYNGPLWELSPVEVRSRPVPPNSSEPALAGPEAGIFSSEQVDVAAFKAFLRQRGLGVVVMRNVTNRDRADKQQPFNLRVPGGIQTVGASGTIYDIQHFQFFQGDQIRGIGGQANPRAGRRVIAQILHDPAVGTLNLPNPGGPAGSVPIAADSSVAAFVPARRALSWQSNAPNGNPVVRERFWITLQPGEIRTCDGCHGINTSNQANQPGPAVNSPQALRDLLIRWKAQNGDLFSNGFEG